MHEPGAQPLQEWDTGQLRARRHALQVDEEAISYARRILHGRIDLVNAELAHRTEDDAGPIGDLVERLVAVLANRPSGPRELTALRAMQLRHPPRAEAYEQRIDAILPAGMRLADESDASLQAAAESLLALERALSQQRRELFAEIDALQGELAARYRDGRARPEDVFDRD